MEEELQTSDSALLDKEDKNGENTKKEARVSNAKSRYSVTSTDLDFHEVVEEAEMLTKEELYRHAYNLDDGEYGGMIKLIVLQQSSSVRERLSHYSN